MVHRRGDENNATTLAQSKRYEKKKSCTTITVLNQVIFQDSWVLRSSPIAEVGAMVMGPEGAGVGSTTGAGVSATVGAGVSGTTGAAVISVGAGVFKVAATVGTGVKTYGIVGSD